MISPPSGFVDLATAHRSMENAFRRFIGVVVDIMPPTITRSGEHMMTFKVSDPTMRDAVDNNGLRVRFFRKDPNLLPQIKQCGDIILLKNIKMSRFQEQTIGLSNLQTQAVVFPIASIPDLDEPMAYTKPLHCLGHQQIKPAVQSPEHVYVVQLKHEMQHEIDRLPSEQISMPQLGDMNTAETGPVPRKPPQSDSSLGRKFKLVKDLRHKDFADICGQVVKKFPGHHGCELYITDYTENRETFFYNPPEMEASEGRDGDEFGHTTISKKSWPGPYGYLILKVNTQEPHSSYANNSVKEGDLVLLQNVRGKVRTQLEGEMWPDEANRNPDKVQIKKSTTINNSPEVQALLARKERYWAARKTKFPANEEGEKKKLTKSEKKRLRKQANKATALPDDGSKEESESANTTSKKGLNQHVRCGHQEIPISTIRTILDPENKIHTCTMPNGSTQILPFVNAKYRTRVRVIDFYPKALQDFAIASDDPNLGPPNNVYSSQSHEWNFSLLLEDATTKPASGTRETMWATLHHEEAQYLFGNNVGDPTDLRADHALLSKVKQQLFVLWGDLEEKGYGEGLSNLPFECCLMEYGVEVDEEDLVKGEMLCGWRRFYALLGTTIL